ncbi:YdeI/OmpD-associated family protein [Siphonobacter aquaeclarae]|uniref:Bacteriocin-protection, YdeI or OmpD-Associated n=1 Tax=Siphonobacter aquaeclarae TaxID=563176 RepID=A0A1G9MTF2_9BACT|nr:YdeI/OmpD-associated family protein [Siphonobacter aquaeclarae]SDL76915.1 Bacteriocin-protection, YdeI or OmpD-Associated [Siphonobacter aquaeclarae]
MDEPLTDNEYLLRRFPGKGGWTFAEIPEIPPDKHAWFGWVRVRGTIDDFEIRGYHLMPMGNGHLFLPVKAEIRKKIKKKEGDTVRIVLYPDDIPTEIPEELADCLKDAPGVYDAFLRLTDAEQKAAIDWIYTAKQEDTKARRIVKTIENLQKKQS